MTILIETSYFVIRKVLSRYADQLRGYFEADLRCCCFLAQAKSRVPHGAAQNFHLNPFRRMTNMSANDRSFNAFFPSNLRHLSTKLDEMVIPRFFLRRNIMDIELCVLKNLVKRKGG